MGDPVIEMIVADTMNRLKCWYKGYLSATIGTPIAWEIMVGEVGWRGPTNYAKLFYDTGRGMSDRMIQTYCSTLLTELPFEPAEKAEYIVGFLEGLAASKKRQGL